MISHQLQTADFSLEQEYQALRDNNPQAGGIICFIGLVRDRAKDKEALLSATATVTGQSVQAIELSIYPGMTEQSIATIATDVNDRFAIEELRIIHRYGVLKPNAQIVLVGIASKHRSEGFLAAEMAMDYLKSKAIFWKRERYLISQSATENSHGSKNSHDFHNTNSRELWIEPTTNDLNALDRWKK